MGGLKLFCGYRDWAVRIYDTLGVDWDFVSSPEELKQATEKNNYDTIFFIGWSWIVDEKLLESSRCICMHPSALPKYRGGSPIQNQIIDGVTDSAVTFFIMDNELDHGRILWQEEMKLVGSLTYIFAKMSILGRLGIEFILDNPEHQGYEQDHSQATICRRRKPKDSEIKSQDFSCMTAKQLYNKIRCLQDPYPNPYIECADGTKLFIKEAYHE
jgi:methionyl-tRNA formyltransferase